MKRLMLITLLVALSVFNILGVSASKELYEKKRFSYTNNNNVVFDEQQLSTMYDLGFTEHEISVLTQSEFNKFKNYKVLSKDSKDEYIKTMIGYDKKGKKYIIEEKMSKDKYYNDYKKHKEKEQLDLIDLQVNESISDSSQGLITSRLIVFDPGDGGGGGTPPEITNGLNCFHYDDEVICFKEANYRKITVSMAIISNQNMFIKNTIEWLELPKTRERDVLGIVVPLNTTVVPQSYGGKQVWSAYHTGEVNVLDSLSYDQLHVDILPSQFGVTLIQNLVDDYNPPTMPIYNFVFQLEQSLWVTAEYLPGFPNYRTNIENDPGSEDISAIGSNKHCSKAFNLDNMTVGISTTGAISISNTNNSTFDEIQLVATLDKDAIKNNHYYDEEKVESDTEDQFTISSYVNRNDVFISQKQLDKLLIMGFHRSEIDYLTQSEYNTLSNHVLISSVTTREDSSSYKYLTITTSKLGSGNYFIKAYLYWKKPPQIREHDLIGIKLPPNLTLMNYSGKQITTNVLSDILFNPIYDYTKSVIDYESTNDDYFSVNSYGVIMMNNLVNNDEEIIITLQLEVQGVIESSNLPIAVYMHQTDSDYYNTSWCYMSSLSNETILFNVSFYENHFDTKYITTNN